MQAILTKYLCPTNTKGGRVKASCQAGSVIVGWDHALNPSDNHVAAASALCAKIAKANAKKYGSDPAKDPWSGLRMHGQLPDGSWTHVFLNSACRITKEA